MALTHTDHLAEEVGTKISVMQFDSRRLQTFIFASANIDSPDFLIQGF